MITFNPPKLVLLKNNQGSEKEVTLTALTLRQALDNPYDKTVSVCFFETRFPVIIWAGDEYDTAGDWTQEQLETAILAKFNNDVDAFINQALNTPPKLTDEQRKIRLKNIRENYNNNFPKPVWF